MNISPRRIGLRSCLGLTIAYGAVLIIALFSPWLFNAAISASLFIPGKLGLVERKTPADNLSLIVPGREVLHFVHPGKYHIHRNVAAIHFYNISLVSNRTGEAVEIMGIPRKDVPGDDTPLFEFNIEEPGFYAMTVAVTGRTSDQREVLTLVPYVGNQNGAVAFFAMPIQLAIIGLAGWGAYYGLNRKKIRAEKALQASKQTEFEGWLAEERQRKQH
jgi:hypothetical protein